ncbi:hypothetical protein B9Z19DRAFT_1096784 [Tuber borchii]|uniref:C2H2-type domain-containing protein n=1 Tax=Tuber borchii TaxID=42251 RepID=A0A2T6ZB22_TUBBO|nr:hypothetical protein B9Z19DRAFT_1096784 [Tuber borchii]
MSRSYSGPSNNLYNLSDNMDKSTAQQYACDSTSTTGSPSQASQTCSHISTSHIDTIEHYGCSLPLANTSSYRLSPPQFNTSLIAPSFDFDFASFPLGPYWGMGEGSIGNSTEGDYTDGHFEDENYVDGNPTLYTSFQDHRSDSGFNANHVTPSQEFPDYLTGSKPLIPEPGDYHYRTSSYTKGDRVPSDHGSNRGGSENPSASPKKHTNDAKVTKTKKAHQCTENNCGKRFGRSAELKRHKSSVHRKEIAAEERQELFECPHEGCERVGENGFKRKDNLVQHLRGVHGDQIGKKIGRRSTRMSTWSSTSNASAGSPTMATGYEQFSQDQQEEPFVYADQPIEEGSGTPPFSRDFWENLRL